MKYNIFLFIHLPSKKFYIGYTRVMPLSTKKQNLMVEMRRDSGRLHYLFKDVSGAPNKEFSIRLIQSMINTNLREVKKRITALYTKITAVKTNENDNCSEDEDKDENG